MNFTKRLVTPTMAADWLKKNVGTNRHLNKAHVDKLATEIREGRWQVLPHGIVFDTNKRLIDGQHRLHAIIASNTPVSMMVIHDAAPEALEALDTGSPRGIHDLATVTGRVDSGSSARYAARARAVQAVLTGSEAMSSSFTLAKFDAVLATYRPSLDWSMKEYASAQTGNVVGRRVRSSLVMGALVVAHHKAPEPTEAFATRLDTGIGLTGEDPAYALRRYLEATDTIGGPGSKRIPAIYATLRSVYAAIHGQKLMVIRTAYLNRDNPEFARMLKFFGVGEGKKS